MGSVEEVGKTNAFTSEERPWQKSKRIKSDTKKPNKKNYNVFQTAQAALSKRLISFYKTY